MLGRKKVQLLFGDGWTWQVQLVFRGIAVLAFAAHDAKFIPPPQQRWWPRLAGSHRRKEGRLQVGEAPTLSWLDSKRALFSPEKLTMSPENQWLVGRCISYMKKWLGNSSWPLQDGGPITTIFVDFSPVIPINQPWFFIGFAGVISLPYN